MRSLSKKYGKSLPQMIKDMNGDIYIAHPDIPVQKIKSTAVRHLKRAPQETLASVMARLKCGVDYPCEHSMCCNCATEEDCECGC